MTTTSRPRHSRKEVRQLADWLTTELGAVLDDFDTNGHAIYRFPNGKTIKLPETPKGHSWVSRTRADALKAAGHQVTGKYDAAAARQREATRRNLARAAAQRAAERREAELLRRTETESDRRRRIMAEADLNRYAALMGTGHHSGGYRRSSVG